VAAAALPAVAMATRKPHMSIFADERLAPATLGIDGDLYCDLTTNIWWMKRDGIWKFFVDHSELV
jgi:hypothetical protein